MGHTAEYLDLVGASLLLAHLRDLLLVLALLALAGALGARMRFLMNRLSGTPSGPETESVRRGTWDVLVDLVLGLVSVGFAVFLEAALGWMTPLTLGLIFPVLAVLAWTGWGDFVRGLEQLARELRREARKEILLFPALLVWGAVGLFLVTLALAPPVDWDSLMYHLEVPKEILRHGGWVLPPDNLHVAYVGLIHMLYMPLLAFGSPAAPALLSGFMGLLLGLALLDFGRRHLDLASGSVAMALLYGTGSVLLVAMTPRIDVTLALLLFLGQGCLFEGLFGKGRGAGWIQGSILLGAAVATKYHAVPYLLGLSPLVLWGLLRGQDRALRARELTAGVALGAVVVVPWLLKNWVLLGGAFFPFFLPRAMEPWLAAALGSGDIPPGIPEGTFRILRQVREPLTFGGIFGASGPATVESEGAFYRANPILMALPLSLLFLRRTRALSWLLVPGIVYLLVLLQPWGAANPRYLIPVVPPFTLAAAYGIHRILEHLSSIRLRRGILLVGMLLLLDPGWDAGRRWMLGTRAPEHLLGLTSGRAYMAQYLDPGVQGYGELVSRVNEVVPEEDTVLLLWEARGLFFRPQVLQDNRLTNWPLLNAGLPEGKCLEEAGVDYLVLGHGAARYYQVRGADPSLFRLDAFQSFAQRCLIPLEQVRGFQLFRHR